MRSRCQTLRSPPLCCTTDPSGRLPTTSPTLAFTAGFIFEPTRMQERVWAKRSAAQSTRTTYVACTMTTERSVRERFAIRVPRQTTAFDGRSRQLLPIPALTQPPRCSMVFVRLLECHFQSHFGVIFQGVWRSAGIHFLTPTREIIKPCECAVHVLRASLTSRSGTLIFMSSVRTQQTAPTANTLISLCFLHSSLRMELLPGVVRTVTNETIAVADCIARLGITGASFGPNSNHQGDLICLFFQFCWKPSRSRRRARP